MQANLNDDDRIVANKNNGQTERAKETFVYHQLDCLALLLALHF